MTVYQINTIPGLKILFMPIFTSTRSRDEKYE